MFVSFLGLDWVALYLFPFIFICFQEESSAEEGYVGERFMRLHSRFLSSVFHLLKKWPSTLGFIWTHLVSRVVLPRLLPQGVFTLTLEIGVGRCGWGTVLWVDLETMCCSLACVRGSSMHDVCARWSVKWRKYADIFLFKFGWVVVDG